MSSLTLSLSSILPDLAMRPSMGRAAAGVEAPKADFASVLGSLAGDAANTLRQGEAAGIAGVQGTLPMQMVVDQVMAAERTLQTGIAIRDKLVSSFLDITRMQI